MRRRASPCRGRATHASRVPSTPVPEPTPTTGRTDWASLGPDNPALTYVHRTRLGGVSFVQLSCLPITLGLNSGEALVVTVIIVALIIGLVKLINKMTRPSARKELLAQPDLPLAKRVLISGFARGCPDSFDVDLWIKETGPAGPRTVLGNIAGPIPVQDNTVYEDVDIDAEIASTNIRRAAVILLLVILLALSAVVIWRVGVTNTALLAVVVPYLACLLGAFLYHYRLNPVLRRVSITSIGTLEVTSLGRTTTFAREDSLLFLTNVMMTERIEVSVLRRDGQHARFWFPNPRDPTLGKLLAHWTHPAR